MAKMVGASSEERRAIQQRLTPLWDALAEWPAAMGLKAALEMLGVRAGVPRLPYVALDDDERARLREALERHGLLEAAAR
jgi:dihydrodipicolinate synthase/N-acetylneuraminate lyase